MPHHRPWFKTAPKLQTRIPHLVVASQNGYRHATQLYMLQFFAGCKNIVMCFPTKRKEVKVSLKSKAISELPLKDRVAIAKMARFELPVLYSTFVTQIREQYGFVTGNKELMESCRTLSGNDKFDMSNGPVMIIDLMWARLRRTHAMRPVK